jgi:hypothetical protein
MPVFALEAVPKNHRRLAGIVSVAGQVDRRKDVAFFPKISLKRRKSRGNLILIIQSFENFFEWFLRVWSWRV